MGKPEFVRTKGRVGALYGACLTAYAVNIALSVARGAWTELVAWILAAMWNTLWVLEK